MSTRIIPENEPQIQPRDPFLRPGPIPDIRLEGLYFEKPPTLVVRAASSSESSSATTSCSSNDDSGACEKYYGSGSSTTLPIVLGVVIPLGIAFILLIYLHRRHVNKLKREDAEDERKALDFGLDGPQRNSRKKADMNKNLPQMSMAGEKEFGGRGDRGLSMDLGIGNPYLLPPELQQSRESLHSLSRSNTDDDKYRATTFIPDDGSIRPPSSLRSPRDDSSSFTGSSSRRFHQDSRLNLVQHAQANPTGPPATHASISSRNPSADALPSGRKPLPSQVNNGGLLAPAGPDPARESFISTTSSNGQVHALRASNNYLAQFISGGGSFHKHEAGTKEADITIAEIRVDPPTDHIQSPPPAVIKDETHSRQLSSATAQSYGDPSTAPGVALHLPDERQPRLPQLNFIDSQDNKHGALDLDSPAEYERVTTPLAPASHDTNIRSTDSLSQQEQPQNYNQQDQYYEDDYYDEYEVSGDHDHQEYHGHQHDEDYIDPRRLTMGMRPLPPDDPSENPEQRANRIRSFYKEYFDDSKTQNVAQNHQYYDGSEDYYDNNGPADYYNQGYYAPHVQSQARVYGRHRATISNGSYMSAPGPRAYSSLSGQYGGPPAPKKKLPPPKPLNILPTPHMLKEDTFLPIDFAPPQKYQHQRAGTPDSLRGGKRPYSPATKAHVPLVSSFDDLAVIPSPHALRKSTTFTALDFAPPSRIRTGDAMSDSGSIRSNRSAMSAMHLHSIRTGAYRVSRIPKEVAGTKDEITAALKPQWDLNR